MSDMTYEEQIDDFLEHSGVKGMKWGERRAVNKASKAADNEKRNTAIDAARKEYSTNARKNYLDAKATYKTDKNVIGKHAAKKAFDAVKQKNIDDASVAQQLKSGKETRKAVMQVAGAMVVVGALSALSHS
jgi:hypothetical protein